MTIRVTGVHHLAISTADIKGQIEFFSDVLGAELIGLFWMHGIPGGRHAFCQLNDFCSISFVQLPGNAEAKAELGVTHAGSGGGPSAPGTMQHIAFRVDTEAELLGMRDRIRSKGVNVIGVIDHGMCRSIYFGGPEGLTLEVAMSTVAVDAQAWIDPEVVAEAGIDATELERYKNPQPFVPGAIPIAQPTMDPDKPHMAYPPEVYASILAMADTEIEGNISYPNPPVDLAAGDESS